MTMITAAGPCLTYTVGIILGVSLTLMAISFFNKGLGMKKTPFVQRASVGDYIRSIRGHVKGCEVHALYW